MPERRLAAHRLPALVFAGFVAVIAVSAAALFFLKLGGTPSGLAAHFRGDEARFVPARSLDGLLLVAVPHLVAVPLVLFAGAHVVGWARVLPARVYRALLALSFGGAALSIAGGFLVRFVAPGLAWAKVLGFAGLEVALLAWAALLVLVFAPLGRRAAAPAPEPDATAPPPRVAPPRRPGPAAGTG